jgi:hypothetical protein
VWGELHFTGECHHHPWFCIVVISKKEKLKIKKLKLKFIKFEKMEKNKKTKKN